MQGMGGGERIERGDKFVAFIKEYYNPLFYIIIWSNYLINCYFLKTSLRIKIIGNCFLPSLSLVCDIQKIYHYSLNTWAFLVGFINIFLIR